MSLINQMLRDLESRRKVGGEPSLQNEISVAPVQQKRNLYYLGTGLVVLIAAIALCFNFLPAWQPAAPVAPSAITSLPLQQPAVAEEPVEPLAATRSEVQTDKVVATAPVAGNAQILTLKLFETGTLTRILLEFSQLPEYGWEIPDEDGRTLQVRFPQSEIRSDLQIPLPTGPLLKDLHLEKRQDALLLLVDGHRKLNLEMFELAADQLHGPRLLLEFYPPVGQPVAAPETTSEAEPTKIAKANVEGSGRLNKKSLPKTPAELAAGYYRTAVQQLQTKQRLAAERSLLKALQLQPGLLDARLQMISLLQSQGRTADAADYVREGFRLHPDSAAIRKHYAYQLMASGQQAKAVEVLQAAPLPKLRADLEYYALLAALQREAGQYQPAVETYRRLIKVRPQESLWWLGMAIALEQSGNPGAAKDAYRQAQSLPGLRADLRDYAEQRLQAL